MLRKIIAGTLGSTFLLTSAVFLSSPAHAEPVTVTVQSFNVCKGGADGTHAACAAPAPSWSIRRDRVANVVRDTQADVVGFQEVTNHSTPNGARTQREDMEALLTGIGYAVPRYNERGEENACRRPRDGSGRLTGASPCVNTALLAYNPQTTTQAIAPNNTPTAGLAIANQINPNIDPSGASRSVAWGFFTKSGKTFLAISAHTSNTKNPEAEEGRRNFGIGLSSWATQLIQSRGFPDTIPIILLADLNSYQKRNPNGVQQVLTDNGWQDAFNAPTKRNIQYSTINYTSNASKLRGDSQGFPKRPIATKKTRNNPLGAATRIDYIMGLGNMEFNEYEVLVWLNPDGTFNENYQASDHQSIKATVTLS